MDDKPSYEELKGRIEEALDLIKDDPKLEKEMDEIPRLNYLLECIKRTLEPQNIMNDKEKIKEALELLDELVEYTNNQGANWREPWAKGVIEKIKEILEKQYFKSMKASRIG